MKVILKNLSRKTIISSQCKIATTLTDFLFGLLLKRNHAILFKTRFGIHTIGLSKGIDVIVLDSAWKVVKTKNNLRSNRIFFWKPVYNLIIELPEGSIEKSKTMVGDQTNYVSPCFKTGGLDSWFLR